MQPVEPFLAETARRLGEQVASFEPEIATFARYALASQGKQLRPALVALAGGAAGKLNDHHVTVAVIIEMVHLATLVHDDIMDGAELRRRRPTLAANWGNEISVLLGDCLFAHALQLAASFPTPEICRAVSLATKTVCTGEILQTLRRRQTALTQADYFRVLEMKTAELFALSCELGGWLSGATAEERAALRGYGLALGTAYQIFDDCVDLFAVESVAGKSLGTDIAKGKLTLPVLVALERATPADRAALQAFIESWEPANLGELLAILERCDALAESRRVMDGYLARAQRALATLPESDPRTALAEVARFLARQTEGLGLS